MPAKHLYEYAVIRLVPVLQREEFVNVGVLLLCKRAGVILVRTRLDEARITHWSEAVDLEQVRANLASFERIALGVADAGPIARFDAAERFRWLTAMRSSAIQTSRPHPGVTDDLERTTDRLFAELVL